MSRFQTSLRVGQLDDGVHWLVLDPLVYEDDALGVISVPSGFVTDGGSIPAMFQGFINPYGKGFKAFVVHDYLYATQTFTREQSDECLRRALGACGENWLDSKTQFDAVRLGGENAWLEDQKTYDLKKEAPSNGNIDPSTVPSPNPEPDAA